MITIGRCVLGVSLIHLGIRLLPRGWMRSELYQLIDVWDSKVKTRQAKHLEKVS